MAVISIELAAGGRTGPVSLSHPEDVTFRVSRERLNGIRDAFAAVGVDWSKPTVINASGSTRAQGAEAAA